MEATCCIHKKVRPGLTEGQNRSSFAFPSDFACQIIQDGGFTWRADHNDYGRL